MSSHPDHVGSPSVLLPDELRTRLELRSGQLRAMLPEVHRETGKWLILAADDLDSAAAALEAKDEALRRLDLTCTTDVLNPCWDARPTDKPGRHWGWGEACASCQARFALSLSGGAR